MIEVLKPLFGKLAKFGQNRLGFAHPPRLFLKKDEENSCKALGKTAHYDPNNESVTIYTSSRHPKDILRSFAHEMVHHAQNLRGDLSPEKCGSLGSKYAQEDPHMRKMEEEAYLLGNMCFRDWEDSLNNKEKYIIKLAESKYLKEKSKMLQNPKITKKMLINEINKFLEEAAPLASLSPSDLKSSSGSSNTGSAQKKKTKKVCEIPTKVG